MEHTYNWIGNPSPDPNATTNEAPADDSNDDPEYEQPDTAAHGGKDRRKRTRKTSGVKDSTDVGSVQGQKAQTSLERFTQAKGYNNQIAPGPDNAKATVTPGLEEDPNLDRRKRRKTASPPPSVQPAQARAAQQAETLDWHQRLQVEDKKDRGEHTSSQTAPSLPTVELVFDASVSSNNMGEITAVADETPNRTTSKKRTLKISKNGKLLSSPSKPVTDESLGPKKRRVRKPTKAKLSPTITVIKYGSDVESCRAIGQKIDDILGGKKTFLLDPTISKKAKPTVSPPGPPKPTHPFFLGKAAQKEDALPVDPTPEKQISLRPSTPRKSAVTPGKLKAESRGRQPVQPAEPADAFGYHTGAGRAVKQLGLNEAPWPTKDNAHVRSIDAHHLVDTISGENSINSLSHPRKLKSSHITVPRSENLIFALAHQLRLAFMSANNFGDCESMKLSNARLPTRLLTTGFDIQERVRKAVKVALSPSVKQKSTHPAISSLFSDIGNTLTPFDKGECEGQTWAQKYAPISASHVLQSGKEATVLRDWLQTLTVLAVQSSKDGTRITTAETKKPPKKRRKKIEDDFIVSSDEDEDEDMVELSGGEEYGRIEWKSSHLKSLKRPQLSRNKNVVILSGPHGCGKSATVYAVAKELGFEVFEINSGSRRSGKDIQDKVGDMSENHLVNQRPGDTKIKLDILPADDTDTDERMSKALQEDITSGRQGTMTSFFKAKSQPKEKAKPKTNVKETYKPSSTTQTTLSATQSRKTQRQSLILFEEADVLFEEDQQFWAQVTKLASQSKRPIIITCTNELSIPSYDLPIAAILRLSPPPLDLATDYMLALVAREGHILDRKAVGDLFRSRDHDLRATINELDFWCQMSIGDRKGGLEWIYQRWPPGKDVDELGRVLRVASQGTYQSGMGLLSHDLFATTDSVGFDKEEELLKETWVDWCLRPDAWKGPGTQDAVTTSDNEDSNNRLQSLKRLDLMCESVSATDVYCRVGLPSYNEFYNEPTDPSLPVMSDKERSNYTISAPVIQVDHMSDFASFDRDMYTQSHLSIWRAFGGSSRTELQKEDSSKPSNEDEITKAIIEYKRDGQTRQSLTRLDFSEAFDILAYPPDIIPSLSTSYHLTASSFDRTFKVVVEDLAPFVRSIVSHELRLETERVRLSNLLSEGGGSKRSRTTRASRVALEGGTRETKRRERWFETDLNRTLVMGTAGKSWSGMGSLAEETEASSRGGESLIGSQE